MKIDSVLIGKRNPPTGICEHYVKPAALVDETDPITLR